MTCAHCGVEFTATATQAHNRMYCSPQCKYTAYDRKRAPPQPDAVYTLTDVEWAYAAGIVDGEGCFYVNASGKHFSPRVEVANTNTALMVWFHSRFGGNVRATVPRRSNHKPVNKWSLVSFRTLRPFMCGLLPYMVIKRAQCEALLAFCSGVQGQARRGRWLPNDELARRRSLKEQMTILNKRGVA